MLKQLQPDFYKRSYPSYEAYISSFSEGAQAVIRKHNSGVEIICSGEFPSDNDGRSDWSKTWVECKGRCCPIKDRNTLVFEYDEKLYKIELRLFPGAGGCYIVDEQGYPHDVRERYCVAVPV